MQNQEKIECSSNNELPNIWSALFISMINPLVAFIFFHLCFYVLKVQALSSFMMYGLLIYVPFSLILYSLVAVLKAYVASFFNKQPLKNLVLYQYERPFFFLNLCPLISFALISYFLGFAMAFFILAFLAMNVIVQLSFEVYLVFSKKF